MANNAKAPISNDDLMYEEFDIANKQHYYKRAREQLEKTCRQTGVKLTEEMIENQINLYKQSLRNYYYNVELLTYNKNNQFFDEAIRDVHPTMKIKSAVKGLIRIFNKVLIQQLAETCFQLSNKTGKAQIDCDLLNDAYRLMEKRKRKKLNVGSLFTHMHN